MRGGEADGVCEAVFTGMVSMLRVARFLAFLSLIPREFAFIFHLGLAHEVGGVKIALLQLISFGT